MPGKYALKKCVALLYLIHSIAWVNTLYFYFDHYLLLFPKVWMKKYIFHSNVNSISEWQSGSRGFQSDNWHKVQQGVDL